MSPTKPTPKTPPRTHRDKISQSFELYAPHADLLQARADEAGLEKSQFMRRLILRHLGVPDTEIELYARGGRATSLIDAVSAMLPNGSGLTPLEVTQALAKTLQDLERSKQVAAKREATRTSRSRSGEHQLDLVGRSSSPPPTTKATRKR